MSSQHASEGHAHGHSRTGLLDGGGVFDAVKVGCDFGHVVQLLRSVVIVVGGGFAKAMIASGAGHIATFAAARD